VIDTTKYEQALVQASEQTARRLTSRLRRSAYRSGWPTSIARHLTVRHNDGDFDIHYPESVARKVEDLEYGTQSAPPNAVMQQFRNRIGLHSGESVR
jgi:hypothetical protein